MDARYRIASMTDENVLNTEQDEHSIVVFDEKGESGRTEHVVHHLLSRSTRRAFLSSPIMHPSPLVLRVLFGSERVQGVPASDSLVGGGCNFSVYARACRNCFVPIRILDSQFYSLNSTKTFGQMIYNFKGFHSKNWKGCLKKDGSEC